MTPAEAADLHSRVTAFGAHLIWFVTVSDPAYPGQAVAWAVVANTHGGARQPGELVASTLEELQAMLPMGLMRREQTPFIPKGVVEAWD